MNDRTTYQPGPARGAEILKDGDEWALVIKRELRHSPEKVWEAITDPAHLREWAPFDASGSLGSTGAKVTLSTVGAAHVTETTVTQADAPNLLEYKWGDIEMRWTLESLGTGTRLTLWSKIDRRYIAMGAAGWHICLDVMDHYLGGEAIGRIVAGDAMKFEGWQRLHKEYAQQFGVEAPGW